MRVVFSPTYCTCFTMTLFVSPGRYGPGDALAGAIQSFSPSAQLS
jgi:hypothetical protein